MATSVFFSIRIWLCFVLFNYLTSNASAFDTAERVIRSADAERVAFESDLVLSVDGNKREDLCGLCDCVKDGLFTITCNLSGYKNLHKKFGSEFSIDKRATSLHMLLPPGARIYFEKGFFDNTFINGVIIEGRMQGEQIEINAGVFADNMGPNPEIQFLNCHSVILHPKSFKGDFKLLIKQSHDVIIFGNAFADAFLIANFTQIDDLRIEEQTFHNNKAVLNINYCNLDNIRSFKTSLSMITFSHCTIGTIHSEAFDVNSIPSIRFNACEINVIRSRAITEKLQSNELAITGTVIGTIESEAISGGISELVLSGNRIYKIQTNAIQVTAINVTISKNNITHLERQWLFVRDLSNVVVKKNVFGVFGEMAFESPPSAQRLSTCRFEENYLTKPLPASLNMPDRSCQFHKVSIKKQCTCNTTWLEELSHHDLRSETYCMLQGTLERCYNTTMISYAKYISDVCDETKTKIDCRNERVHRVDGKFYTDEELREKEDTSNMIIFALIVLAVIIAFVSIICLFRSWIVRKMNVSTENNLLKPVNPAPSAPIEQPEESTYTEIQPPRPVPIDNVSEQRPLIGNYAVPSDKYNESDIYSVPFKDERTTNQTQSTYQIPPPLPSISQIPKSTSSRSETKVQKMARTFENDQSTIPYIDHVKPSSKSSVPLASRSGSANHNNTSSSDSGSYHSGGSVATTKLDDDNN